MWLEGINVCTNPDLTSVATSSSGNAATFGCGDDLTEDARKLPDACPFCTYAFAPMVTVQTRATHPDGCCYEAYHPSKGRPFVVEAREREASLVRDLGGWSA